MDAIWWQKAQIREFDHLKEDLQVPVLIIGGGMTGVLCAHFLQQAGVECMLAEAGRILHGTTGNTTAKITAQHGLIYDRLIREWGIERADMYLRANLRALEEFRQLSGTFSCRFEEKNAYVFSRNDQGALERELRALEKLRYPARFADALGLPFSVVGAVCFPHQAQFDPIQFGAALVSEVEGAGGRLCIFENTRIIGGRRSRPGTAGRAGKVSVDQADIFQ